MPIRTEWWTLLTQLMSAHFQFTRLFKKIHENVVVIFKLLHLLAYLLSHKMTPTSLTICDLGQWVMSAPYSSALKAFNVDRMICFCLNFIFFLSAWYFWIHCCLLMCPLMLSEPKQSINDSIKALSEPWKSKCQSATACHEWFGSVFVACVMDTEIQKRLEPVFTELIKYCC